MNLTALKKEVKILDVIDHYDIELTQKGKDWVGECPFCLTRSFKVSEAKNAWNCFGCKRGGNILDFVAIKELCTINQSADIIKGWATSAKSVATKLEVSEKTVERHVNKAITISLKLDPTRTPFKEETAEHFNAGHCSKGLMRGLVAIPIHNTEGEVVAYVGKGGEDDKYPKDYSLGVDVYNLHRCHGKHVFVCKDFYEVWKYFETGKDAVSFVGEPTQEQVELIINSGVRAVTLTHDIPFDLLIALTKKLYVRNP